MSEKDKPAGETNTTESAAVAADSPTIEAPVAPVAPAAPIAVAKQPRLIKLWQAAAVAAACLVVGGVAGGLITSSGDDDPWGHGDFREFRTGFAFPGGGQGMPIPVQPYGQQYGQQFGNPYGGQFGGQMGGQGFQGGPGGQVFIGPDGQPLQMMPLEGQEPSKPKAPAAPASPKG